MKGRQNPPFVPDILSLKLFDFQFSKLLSYRKIRVAWILFGTTNRYVNFWTLGASPFVRPPVLRVPPLAGGFFSGLLSLEVLVDPSPRVASLYWERWGWPRPLRQFGVNAQEDV